MSIPHRFSLAHCRLLAISGIGAFAIFTGSILAAPNNRNDTGLPLYPNATTGSQYAPMDVKGVWYAIYTAQSNDSLAKVEDWYRHHLPQAKETKDEGGMTHGITLTVGKDRVLVYQLGNRPGAVIELQKYVKG